MEDNKCSFREIKNEKYSCPPIKNTSDTSIDGKSYYESKDNIIKLITEKNPEFLETFKIERYIKSGSDGIFYEAYYKKTETKVGLKFYINHKENEKEEIIYLRKLKNKRIISLFGYMIIDENIDVAILEFAKWQDLHYFQNKIIKKKYLSETFLCYITYQILEALIYIHRNKIVHADIKQANILLDSNLNIKITDFSVSSSYEKFNDDQELIFPFAGTGKYIPPEIIGKKGVYAKDSSKIDIYSLGITLFYLAYGTYPYNLKGVDSSDYDAILKTLEEQKELVFPQERKISPMFKDFLKGILEIDINKRFNAKEAFEHSWIKGAEIINDEKEIINCLDKFLIEVVTDSIIKFNGYIKGKN